MRLIWERNRGQLLQCLVALGCLFVIATADARQWVTITGQPFEAEFVRVEREKARNDLSAVGFKNVRFEMFPGGHQLHRPHLQAALEWFLAERNKSGAVPAR